MRCLAGCVALLLLGTTLGQETEAQKAAKAEVVRVDLRNLTKALDAYHRLFGKYPRDWKALTEGDRPFLEAVPLDPWKKPYRYDPAGKRNKGARPDVWTVTPDKQTLGNWQQEKARKPAGG